MFLKGSLWLLVVAVCLQRGLSDHRSLRSAGRCEGWCSGPCHALNSDFRAECSSCEENKACRPATFDADKKSDDDYDWSALDDDFANDDPEDDSPANWNSTVDGNYDDDMTPESPDDDAFGDDDDAFGDDDWNPSNQNHSAADVWEHLMEQVCRFIR